MLIDLRMLNMSIINDLNSSSVNDPLSAYMGKVLNESKQDKELSSFELVVDATNGVSASAADGTVSAPFSTLSDAYDSLPDFCKNVTIRMKPGTYTESSALDLYKNIVNLSIEPFASGNVVTLSGFAIKVSNSQNVTIGNLSFNVNNNTITDALILEGVDFEINSCSFSNCTNGIKTLKSNGLVSQCSFENVTGSAVYANNASIVLVDACTTIDNVSVGITSNGSVVMRNGIGLTADTLFITLRNGQVINSNTANMNMFDYAKLYNENNSYVWPNMNAIGDTRTTEDVWLKSMTAYGSYSRYATNNSLTVMSESDFWQSIVDGAMVKFIDNSSSS